jgi:hypothetical protein
LSPKTKKTAYEILNLMTLGLSHEGRYPLQSLTHFEHDFKDLKDAQDAVLSNKQKKHRPVRGQRRSLGQKIKQNKRWPCATRASKICDSRVIKRQGSPQQIFAARRSVLFCAQRPCAARGIGADGQRLLVTFGATKVTSPIAATER